MAEDRIYVGSRARILLPAVDVAPDGETTLDPSGMTVQVWRPDGTEVTGLTLGEDDDGVAYIDFAEDQLNMAGIWRAQGEQNGYESRPVTWRVYP